MASSTPTATPCRGAPATGSTPTVSPEETNFLRFVNLVLRRAPKAIRIHFDTVHPPINLVTDLATQKTLLFSLKARKVINQVQWDKLFKVNNPVSKDFDVTLLICLLRNMSPSTPAPAGGFDVLPNPSDVSTGADLARIKFYRNEVAHSANARMDANDFNTSWTHVEEAIGRLGGSALLNETKALRFSPMDESEKELLLELLLEIKHLKMEQLETIPPNVRELIEEKLVSWEKEDELFVEIRASTAVENFVNDNPCVVVVGHPGSGKSAIIHHIALKMGKQGFSIIPIDRPDEIKSYHDRKNPQVFVIDDPCGEFIVDEQAASAWVKYSKDIETCLNFQQKEDQVKSKLLVSCRFVVSRTRPFRLIKIFSNFIINLENHENKLSVFEKEQILSAHVQHEVHLPQLVIEKNFDCFPYLCKIYANAFTDSACMEAFFENPFIELVSKLNVMVDDPRSEAIHEYCALVCCALAEKRVNSYVMGIKRNVADEHLQEILNACDRQIDSSNLLSALERMNGKYVKKVGCTFALIHSKFLEVVVWHFGNRCPETLILHSCTEIFQNRLRPQGRLQKDFDFKEDKTLLELDKKWMKFYSKRIQNDITQGNFRNIFKNPCMPNALIETCLFDSLVDGHILEETLLKTNLNIPSIITEAYASFSREDLLENSQVKFLHLTIAYNWAAFLEKLFETRNDVLFETLFSQRASTLHLAILSENIEIVQMCLQYYSETFDSLEEFMNFGITYDTHCLFCGIHLTDLSHKLYCPVTQVRIPLLVCVTGKLEILEYLIQKKVCSQKDLISEYQLFEETVSPLMVTSLHGHCSIVRYLLQQGASVNYQNENGISPLHEACQRGHLEVIKILLSNGAKVNSRDTDEETPLSLACRNDFIEIADQLLCNGADINLQDSQGLTPIHKSISDWNIKTVEFLTERNCDINIVSRRGDTPFSLACFYGNCAIVRLLIEKGINRQQLQDGMLKACVKGNKGIISILLEYGAEINWKNTQGLAALHISCAQNNADLVTYLFVKGAVANIQSNDKKTPLHFAAKHLSLKCLSILLQNRAEIMAIDDKGRTALHYALTDFDWYFSKEEEMELEHEGKNNIFQDSTNQEALNKLKRITDILIENKIDLNTADINGQTPLHTACSGNFPEIVKEFLRNKVNVNASDKDDFTPLHIACFKCHFFPVQLLIEHGGRVNATDVHGSSPLHLACVIGNLEVVSTLVKYGAKINIPDKTGSTPLHIAIKNTRQDVIYFLLSNGANVNARDNDGFTPLLLCCCQNYNEIVEILLRFGADYEIEISEGVNAVTMAIKCHHYDISDVLFENGAHLYENNLRYLLQCFINTNDICKFLNKYRGTINKYRNKKGQSILHIATLDNNSYWVGTLLNKTELFKEVDNRGQTAFLYAIYSEVASIIDLFLERCTSGDAIISNLRIKLQRGYICFVETLFKISRLHFDEFEMVFDSGNHDIVRKFMRNVKDYYLTDFTIKYCSSGYDKIITEALKCGKYIDIYNIILARLPDELWNLHKSIIPCLCPERGETSSQNWIKQGEEIEKCLPFDLNLFMLTKFEMWPLLFLRKDCILIMRHIRQRFRYPMNDYLNLFSITDAIGNTFLHYSSLIPNMYFTFDCFNHFKRDFLLSIDEHVNRQNLAGCTPLHYAVQCPCPLNIATLIELGADIEVKDKSGRDVLDYSKACGFQDTEEILKRYNTYRR